MNATWSTVKSGEWSVTSSRWFTEHGKLAHGKLTHGKLTSGKLAPGKLTPGKLIPIFENTIFSSL